MNKPELRQHLTTHLSEFFDGYVIVGRVAGTDHVVIAASSPDLDTTAMLSVGMAGVLNATQGSRRSPGVLPANVQQ